MRSSLQDDEEEKEPDVDFSSLPNPLQDLQNLLSPQEMMFIMMGNHAALNHLPNKIHDHIYSKKRVYNGSFKKYAQHIW